MEDTDLAPFPEQAPTRFEIEQPKDYGQYLLHARSEIAAVLRTLVERRALVGVYFHNGRSFLLTSVLRVDNENNEILLDAGRDEETNRQVLLADHLLLSSTVDKVKIQFVAGKLVETQYAGVSAFRTALPDTLLRLQRREYFRLTTPLTKPVKFVATFRRKDGSALLIEASLLDISGGGIGLMATPALAALLERGAVITDCKMALPDEGLLVANLCVRNKLEVTTRAGAHYVRVGCQFIALPGTRMSMVQRYITRVERERKARLSGM